MKVFIKSLLAGFIITLTLSMVGFSSICDDLREDVLRVHILANSDEQCDQDLKLKVRDEFLNYTEKYLNNLKDKETAINTILQNKVDICNNLERFILSQGYDYKVNIIYTNMYFETRSYLKDNKTITLPAGYYDAIRITIGKGSGKNWWCVMFPQLCLPSAKTTVDINEVLTESETGVIECEIEYKFKIVELFYNVNNWFKKLF